MERFRQFDRSRSCADRPRELPDQAANQIKMILAIRVRQPL